MEFYQICYASHQEVLFRSEADMNTAFNSLCSALYKTGSRCLAETFMSNHHHGCYDTKCPGELMRISRDSYTRYFNEKYERRGMLGEKGIYYVVVEGLRHLLTALTYTLRNCVHHGVEASPFAYPYSSVNAYFRKELGKASSDSILLTPAQIRATLPRRAVFDPSWKMGPEGVFLRESVVAVSIVEAAYATPQAFNYMMGRKSGSDWAKEQEADGTNKPPFTLNSIEEAYLRGKGKHAEQTVMEMLRNEKARYAQRAISDMKLCELIDRQEIKKYNRRSVYHLSEAEKNEIANRLYSKLGIRENQLRRCLVF